LLDRRTFSVTAAMVHERPRSEPPRGSSEAGGSAFALDV
jgi:hypothetical protein